MFVVKFLFHHHTGEGFLADLDVQFCAQFGMGRVDECHADTLASGDGVVASGYLSHFLTIFQHGIAVAWNGLVF